MLSLLVPCLSVSLFLLTAKAQDKVPCLPRPGTDHSQVPPGTHININVTHEYKSIRHPDWKYGPIVKQTNAVRMSPGGSAVLTFNDSSSYVEENRHNLTLLFSGTTLYAAVQYVRSSQGYGYEETWSCRNGSMPYTSSGELELDFMDGSILVGYTLTSLYDYLIIRITNNMEEVTSASPSGNGPSGNGQENIHPNFILGMMGFSVSLIIARDAIFTLPSK